MEHFYYLSALSAFGTIAGSIPALFIRNLSHLGKDMLLAYSAGVMVAASTYGLIPSALKLSNFYVLTAGILLGTVLLTMLERYVPHTDPPHEDTASAIQASSRILLLMSMTLHNLPEGLSTGISLANENGQLGAIVSFAIGVQNVPEGFLIALVMASARSRLLKPLLYVCGVTAAEWLAALVGYSFGHTLEFLIPYGLAFAGGAMLYIVYKELIPESHGDGHEIPSTFAFIIGTLTMIGLTHWLG
ncbi:ZIP family zinc transporter [Paenibacillus phyllosphaerae]|uniref:ZIP family zinc transporter n=1 Tax=Paenibacillus phyllosphaerae TaxID=274593 RepID=A0A7W5AXF8_9BACL|nr:ZIP family metal transporter [Paenibacillus phyllosphaerae]MBB3110259.1 ZIP family zinc transporter [Paenibacillus phyllosphaerae]